MRACADVSCAIELATTIQFTWHRYIEKRKDEKKEEIFNANSLRFD